MYKGTANRPGEICLEFRSMIVREESLAGFSRSYSRPLYQIGKGEKSGGRDRGTILGDLFGSLLGALLLDPRSGNWSSALSIRS